MRHWRVTVKKVGSNELINHELNGEYELHEVRQHFGLDEQGIEWYTIEDEDEDM